MKAFLRVLGFVILVSGPSLRASAREIKTNEVLMPNPPAWVSRHRVNRIVDRIQSLMEWDIRRITVTFYSDQQAFQKLHGFGPLVLAYSSKSDNSIHIGPKVNTGNFDAVFGHELVHIISFQKFHGAIPKWLEEGLANYLAHQGVVRYDWLARQPIPSDVHELVHPFNGSENNTRMVYMASQALAEMIASKCNLLDLLQLSVGKKLENYLDTYCRIKNINTEFRSWIASHNKGPAPASTPRPSPVQSHRFKKKTKRATLSLRSR